MTEIKNKYENKTMWVVLLTAITMVVEIIFGLTTKSMALLATVDMIRKLTTRLNLSPGLLINDYQLTR